MSEARSAPVRGLLLVTALWFAVAAVVYNEWLLASVSGRPLDDVLSRIRVTQIAFALTAVSLVGLGVLAGRIDALGRVLSRPWVAGCMLVLVSTAVPIATVEFALTPFAQRQTSLNGISAAIRSFSCGSSHKPKSNHNYANADQDPRNGPPRIERDAFLAKPKILEVNDIV